MTTTAPTSAAVSITSRGPRRFDVPGVLDDGGVSHRRGVTDLSGPYFLGLPWQYTRGSALPGFVAEDAAHVARAAGMNSGPMLALAGA